ncbi:MAG TPA: hypothetical protein VKT73_05135 [Xanthobacteraceae bacterium]|nr:hypothetical protein [Xanthobacteraceae bacterium]
MKKTVIRRGMFIRSTLIAIRIVAAFCLSSPAMAMHGGGGAGHGGGFGGGGGWHGGGFGAGGIGSMHGGGTGVTIMNHAGGGVGRTVTTPMIGERIHGWSGNVQGRANLTWGRGHDHGHGHFHHHHFVAYGFGGPNLDYGYDSCWTYNGWRWIYVCSDYQH